MPTATTDIVAAVDVVMDDDDDVILSYKSSTWAISNETIPMKQTDTSVSEGLRLLWIKLVCCENECDVRAEKQNLHAIFKNKSFPIQYVSILQRCICKILIALDKMNIPKRKSEYLVSTFVFPFHMWIYLVESWTEF